MNTVRKKQNPFKEKDLKDFTIEDCDVYIDKYPYGDNILEVKKHRKYLVELQREVSPPPPPPGGGSKNGNDSSPGSSSLKPKESNKKDSSVAKTVFSWIALLLAFGLVMFIIISILDVLFPNDAWRPYYRLLYFVAIGFAKLFKD